MTDAETGSLALIASAAYVSTEITAEYGALPPAFLPFGHGRLFESQVRALGQSADRIVLTLPDSFTIDAADSDWLAAQGVEVLPVPVGISLSESIAFALIWCGQISALTLLHGDTLIRDTPECAVDHIAVATAPRGYQWGQIIATDLADAKADPTLPVLTTDVLAGWFSFSKPQVFLECLQQSPNDFVKALELYRDAVGLSAARVEEWLDFGHLHTFHRSRTKVNTSRSFNNVNMDRRTVSKTGHNTDKIDAEARWFEGLPPQMRLFTPAYLGRIDQGYRIAYEFSPTLHELFIFGAVGPRAWQEIATGCMDFLKACAVYADPSQDCLGQDIIENLALRKTNVRLAAWASDAAIGLDQPWVVNGMATPSLRQIIGEVSAMIIQTDPIPGLMHGDFCFPNMFYDYRQQTIKVIDPRGSVIDGKPSNFGDLRYDLAKLNHSVRGYDAILTNRYSLKRPSCYALELVLAENLAGQHFMSSITEHDLQGQRITDGSIQALTVLLFLSMLPLHSDRPDRQYAFLANALRLYHELDQ